MRDGSTIHGGATMVNAIGSSACSMSPGAADGGSSPGRARFVDRIFSKLDANGDGAIDKAELPSFVQMAAGSDDANPVDVDGLFAKLDADSDGAVSKDEFGQAAQQLHDELRGQQLGPGGAGFDLTQVINNLYAKADANGDGSVDDSELGNFIGSL